MTEPGRGDDPDRLPASGAWRPGDDPGHRRFVELFVDTPLRLELGGTLGPVTVAYETWGDLRPDRSNAVMVMHAFTADSHAAGPEGPGHRSPGWWGPMIGPGGPIDTERWFVVCSNMIGGCQGSTGPSSTAPDGRRYGPRFPQVTLRDQVEVEAALARELGVGRWAAVIGGSLGGMRALEWAVSYPEMVERAILIATCAAATAEQIALCSAQIQAVRLDPGFAGGDFYDAPAGRGPTAGMALARWIGHLSYRSELELSERFGRRPQTGEDPENGGRYSVESYLDHQAAKLARRFDANTYIVLSRAMNGHDVGRARGGAAAALGRVAARVTLAGIDSDRLYPLRLQEELAELLPGRHSLQVVRSDVGHDGFLLETDQVGKIIANGLS
jgi:homoserine O-acetyltransferase